ncbi:MAG: sigma-70 family RNA polymerase sigma factor [archaeon]
MSLDQYLKDISLYPVLSQEETAALAREYMATGLLAARDQIAKGNLSFVVFIASKMIKKDYSLDEAVSDGNKGLLRAIETYDPDKGRFTSYSVRWIRQAIFQGQKETKTVHLPYATTTLVHKIDIASQRFFATHGREPLAEELSDILHIGENKIKQVITHMNEYRWPLSLNKKYGKEGTLLSVLPIHHPIIEDLHEQNIKQFLKTCFAQLIPKDREVIEARYYHELSMSDIAKIMGVSVQRIGERHRRAIAKLKSLLLAKFSEEELTDL